MNILLSIASLGIGGAQTFMIRLANELSKSNNVVIYNLHPLKSEQSIINRIDANIKVYSSLFEQIEVKLSKWKVSKVILKRLSQKYNLRSILDQWQILRLINIHKVQIINSHMYLSDSFISKIKTPLSIKKITSFHGCYNLLIESIEKNRTSLSKDHLNSILNSFDFIIIAADRHYEALEKLTFSNKQRPDIVKIYYGYKQNFSSIDKNDSEFIIGMVARGDDYTKGWEEAILAFKQLKEKTKQNIKLWLVGKGKVLENIEKQYHDSDIIFLGYTNTPEIYIQKFDVALLPTYFAAESLPNTIIEYLAYGKPTIATDHAEIPKMISYNQEIAGSLISLRDGKPDVNELAETMLAYINSPELRKIKSSLAYQAFIKFDIETCKSNYEDTYNRIINK